LENIAKIAQRGRHQTLNGL